MRSGQISVVVGERLHFRLVYGVLVAARSRGANQQWRWNGWDRWRCLQLNFHLPGGPLPVPARSLENVLHSFIDAGSIAVQRDPQPRFCELSRRATSLLGPFHQTSADAGR